MSVDLAGLNFDTGHDEQIAKEKGYWKIPISWTRYQGMPGNNIRGLWHSRPLKYKTPDMALVNTDRPASDWITRRAELYLISFLVLFFSICFVLGHKSRKFVLGLLRQLVIGNLRPAIVLVETICIWTLLAIHRLPILDSITY
jgi:hypothetical protein